MSRPAGAPASASAAAELAALRRPFRLGLLACVAGLVCVGGIVAAFGTPADRAAGVAERWLTAVSDSTRDGVAADAAARAEELGASLELARSAGLVGADTGGDAAFEDLRVGREGPAGDAVRVPFTYTPHEGEATGGHLYLVAADGGWRVAALQPQGDPGAHLAVVRTDLELALAPPGPVAIDRPTPAPIGFWVGALALGVVVTAGCAAAVRAATPRP